MRGIGSGSSTENSLKRNRGGGPSLTGTSLSISLLVIDWKQGYNYKGLMEICEEITAVLKQNLTWKLSERIMVPYGTKPLQRILFMYSLLAQKILKTAVILNYIFRPRAS